MNKSPGTPVGSVPNISHDSDESWLGKVGLHGRPTGYCLPLMMKPKDQMKGRRRTRWKSLKTLTCRVSHFRGRGITKCFGENIKILNCYRGTKATREVSWGVIDFGIGGISSGISFPQILFDREKSRVLPFFVENFSTYLSLFVSPMSTAKANKHLFSSCHQNRKKNDRVILFPKKEKGTQI